MGSLFWIQTAGLIRDTFREAMARKIFWGLFGLSTLMILFVLFLLRIDVVEGATATIGLFGFERTRLMDVDRIVRGAHSFVAAFLYSFGMFLAVFASAGLVPAILEPGRIELLLSKPVGRAHILFGRFAGTLLVVTANIAWLVAGVWVVFGWKTGIWNAAFLWTIATTVFLFSVLLSVVFLTGVAFESTALSTMIPVAMIIVSPILAQERTMVKLMSSEWSRQVWRGLYYALPKAADLAMVTLGLVRDRQADWWWPVWTSGVFGAVSLAAAVILFRRRDF